MPISSLRRGQSPLLAGLSALGWACLASDAQAIARVTDVQVLPRCDHTQLRMQASEPVSFHLFAPRNPDHAALDLHGVADAARLDQMPTRLSADARASRLLASTPAPASLRREFVLAAGANPGIESNRTAGGRFEVTLDVHDFDAQIAETGGCAASATAAPTAALVPSAKPSALPLATEPERKAPGSTPATSQAGPPPDTQSGIQEVLLAVVINDLPMPVVPILRQSDGRLLARRADLTKWRFDRLGASALAHEGEDYLELDALPGVRSRIDSASQTLYIDTVASNFVSTELSVGLPHYSTAPAAPLGGYLNYDLSLEAADQRSSVSGLFEAVAFGSRGTLTGAAVARSGADGNGVLRLDTTWTLDRPAQLATWRVDDAVSDAGSWSNAVRLGGVQYATNFANQPGLVTFPLPSLDGVAALPSTVDLYINDALRMRHDVPAGPFSIPELPVVTGIGVARIVVRDLLGREQTIVAPFMASSQLLRPGLRDFSYEIGSVRANFGRANADYGRVVAIATERRGLTDTLTAELHAELDRDRQALGVSAIWLWPAAGVFSAALAASSDHQGGGGLMTAGFQRQARSLSFGASLMLASDRYAALGLRSDLAPPRRLAQAYAGYSVKRWGSFGLSYVRREYRERPDAAVAGASYGIRLGSFGQLSLSLLHDVHAGQTFATLSFSRTLGADTSLSVGATTQGASRDAQVQVQRNLPAGDGHGYRLMAASGDATRAEADLLLQSELGTYELDAALNAGHGAYRAGAAGGLAMIGAQGYATRAIHDSFALVDVAGYPDVRVYAANQLVARTDSNGIALVPHLLPYQNNAIRIEQADLPLDATIDALSLDVVPQFRSGVQVRIPIRRSRGGLITVMLDDGRFLPAGATASIVGQAAVFPSARLGEVYLTGLDDTNVVRLSWRQQSCEIRVEFPVTTDPLPQLGTFQCHGVQR